MEPITRTPIKHHNITMYDRPNSKKLDIINKLTEIEEEATKPEIFNKKLLRVLEPANQIGGEGLSPSTLAPKMRSKSFKNGPDVRDIVKENINKVKVQKVSGNKLTLVMKITEESKHDYSQLFHEMQDAGQKEFQKYN